MAYATPIDVDSDGRTSLPDVFQYVTWAAATNAATVKPVFYCERETVLEAAYCQALTIANGNTLELKFGSTSLGAAHAPTTTSAKMASSATDNIIPAGSTITVTGVGTAAKEILLTLRIRTRIG